MRLHTHVANALDAAGRSTEKRYTQALQREALDAGWPVKAARTIQVIHRDGMLHVKHDADDWEYGTEDRPPLAVTRQFLGRLEEHADRHFQDTTLDALGGLL